MKKFLLLIVAALGCVTMASAQSFAKGDNVASVNIGLAGSYGQPVSVTYEYGICNLGNNMSIGIGALAGFGVDKEHVNGYKHSYSNLIFGARGAWHYTKVDNLDLFAGVTLGYDIVSAEIGGNAKATTTSGFFQGYYVGARYYFTNSFGVNAEIGDGIGLINLGVSLKF